jgi:hypothetical protein
MALLSEDFGVNFNVPLVVLWILIVLGGAVPEIDLQPLVVLIVAPESPNEIEVDPSRVTAMTRPQFGLKVEVTNPILTPRPGSSMAHCADIMSCAFVISRVMLVTRNDH